MELPRGRLGFGEIRYVEKEYSTVDSDSSIGWGCLTWQPPLCFSRREGYEPASGFTFSLPFIIIIIIISHSTIQLHYTNTYTYSHPNLNFLQYPIQILAPHVMWSAQVVRESKIDHTQCHLSALRRTPRA